MKEKRERERDGRKRQGKRGEQERKREVERGFAEVERKERRGRERKKRKQGRGRPRGGRKKEAEKRREEEGEEGLEVVSHPLRTVTLGYDLLLKFLSSAVLQWDQSQNLDKHLWKDLITRCKIVLQKLAQLK
jgi:hypothetical protein